MGDNGVEPVPTSSSSSERPAKERQCTICLSAKFSQECRVHGCNHAFCFSCICEWVCQSLRPSCPMCRNGVEKILYDFAEQRMGRKEIRIKEFRSKNMSLDTIDRFQLFGERRVVVRNLMRAYKVTDLITSEINDIDEAAEPDLKLRTGLVELADFISQHIQKAEVLLADLRTDGVRRDKSVVLNSLTFRRMVYSNKIRIRFPDTKKPKLLPADIAKNPERFREVITDFLTVEFDAIPFQNQDYISGHKWRTKFFGGSIEADQKQRYAADIYDLMLVTPMGNENFQKKLGEILSPVSIAHIKLLESHLDAIIAVEKSSITEFYKEVYYDSVYNSFSQNFFDYNAMLNLREDPQRRFEAIFSQIHREMNPTEWLDPYAARFGRQNSNTGGTDRATNNDDDSDRSDSPEERVPTPMPDDDLHDHTLAQRAHEIIRHFERDHRRRTRHEQTTRTLPIWEQPRSHMTLRSSSRRLQEGTMTTHVGPRSLRVRNDTLSLRVRDFRNQTIDVSNLFQSSSSAIPPLTQFNWSGTFDDITARREAPAQPQTQTQSQPPSRQTQPQYSSHQPQVVQARDIEARNAEFRAFVNRNSISVQAVRRRREVPESYRARPQFGPIDEATARSIQEIMSQINQEDADNGLDFISVAHRTRSARRAASNGEFPGAPPPKRSTNTRRRRN